MSIAPLCHGAHQMGTHRWVPSRISKAQAGIRGEQTSALMHHGGHHGMGGRGWMGISLTMRVTACSVQQHPRTTWHFKKERI